MVCRADASSGSKICVRPERDPGGGAVRSRDLSPVPEHGRRAPGRKGDQERQYQGAEEPER